MNRIQQGITMEIITFVFLGFVVVVFCFVLFFFFVCWLVFLCVCFFFWGGGGGGGDSKGKQSWFAFRYTFSDLVRKNLYSGLLVDVDVMSSICYSLVCDMLLLWDCFYVYLIMM